MGSAIVNPIMPGKADEESGTANFRFLILLSSLAKYYKPCSAEKTGGDLIVARGRPPGGKRGAQNRSSEFHCPKLPASLAAAVVDAFCVKPSRWRQARAARVGVTEGISFCTRRDPNPRPRWSRLKTSCVAETFPARHIYIVELLERPIGPVLCSTTFWTFDLLNPRPKFPIVSFLS